MFLSLIIIGSILFLIILLLIVNRLPLFYRETDKAVLQGKNLTDGLTDGKKEETKQSLGSKLFDPRASAIHRIHGDSEKTSSSDCLVILVHGFSSTPYIYNWAAQKLFESGADVFAPLIPGFGTSPEDFIKTNYSCWYSYIRTAYLKRRTVYRYVFVIGSSMGGTLTLNLAEEMSGTAYTPDGVVTIAASVFINKISQGILKNPGLYMIRTAGWFTPQIGAGISRGASAREGDDGSSRWIGYTGIYPRQLYSLLMGMRRVRKKLQDITVPVQLFHSRRDRTVPFKNLFYIAGRAASPDIRLMIVDSGDKPHNHHCLLMYDSVRLSLTEEIICFMQDIKRKSLKQGETE